MSHYKTPGALRHDAHTLALEAQDLLEATREIADKKVADARKRLESALEHGKEAYENIQEKVVNGAKAADECVRDHPYQAIAIAFAAGAAVTFLLNRRD